MQKGTILYFGNFEMPDKDASAHRVLNNSKILSDLGYNVVFCGVFRENNPANRFFINNRCFDSLPRKYPSCIFEWCKDMLSFAHYEQCIKKYDDIKYIIVYDFHAFPFVKLKRYCNKNGIKMIADVTEWYENKFSLAPVKLVKYLDTEIMMKFLLKKSDGMIVISDFLENYYKKYVKAIINIPPLVDISDSNWQCESTVNNDAVNFVYTGTTDKSKDKIDLILLSLSKLDKKKFHFSIYGITKNDFCNMYPEHIKLLNMLDKNVTFYGKVSHRESIKALFENDCSLIIRKNSRKNIAGFPTKYVESVTSGIDVISSDISNIRRFSNDKTILISESSLTPKLLAVILENYINSFERKSERKINNMFNYKLWSEKFNIIFHL